MEETESLNRTDVALRKKAVVTLQRITWKKAGQIRLKERPWPSVCISAGRDGGGWEAENLASKGQRCGFVKYQPVTQTPLSISEIFTVGRWFSWILKILRISETLLRSGWPQTRKELGEQRGKVSAPDPQVPPGLYLGGL